MAVTPSDCSIENRVIGRKLRSLPTERDIRAVQRGDERQAARSGHGAGQQCADRMRNGVVHVQQVEPGGIGDFEHLYGESQRIGRVLEERIVGDLDFVKEDIFLGGVEAHGQGIADEVDFVAARGQLHAEFGGDDAGTAVRGIAGDADFHASFPTSFALGS